MGQAEVTLHVGYQLDNGDEGRWQPFDAVAVPVAGTRKIGNTQLVGLAEEELALNDVPSGGLLMAVNRGEAGTWIDMRAESGGANLIRFRPGIPGLLPGLTPGARPHVIASRDFVELEILALEI
jgi:hypothetical protein